MIIVPQSCKQNRFRLNQIHQYQKGYDLSHKNKSLNNETCCINKKKEAIFFACDISLPLRSSIRSSIVGSNIYHYKIESLKYAFGPRDIFFKRTVPCFVMIIYVVLPYKNIHVFGFNDAYHHHH